MSDSVQPSKEQAKHDKLVDLMFAKHLQITVRVIGLTVLPVLVFGALGYVLDRALGTAPILLAVSLVLAFVISQVLNVIVFHKLTK